MYRDFKTRNRQLLWTATHTVYLPIEQRDRDTELGKLYQQRKQRRSRSGSRWQNLLQHYDLDLLLKPFFIHLPSPVEMRPWYPSLGDPQKNIPNLISALARLDSAEPWRNQFRSFIEVHPGSSIARMSGKFFPK